MTNPNYLRHYGIVGMRWGKRSGTTAISKMASKNDKLKSKLESTQAKTDKNKEKVDKLTTKLTKQGRYLTTIGYTRAKNTGRKLSRKLHKDQKLNKKMTRLKAKIEKNEALMKTKLKDLPKEDIKAAKAIVDAALSGN